MNSPKSPACSNVTAPERVRLAWGVAAGLLAARVCLGWALWRPGFSTLTWDDFTRVLIAWRWADAPTLAPAEDLVWLPLHSWLMGTIFLLTGDLFANQPLLLATLVNSIAAIGAAALLGATAWRLFASRAGALLAFGVALFARWGVYTSLSGLTEPVYYFAVSLVVWGLVAWQRGSSRWSLGLGAVGVTLAAGIRYEGWLLAGVWLICVASVCASFDRRIRPKEWLAGIWRRRVDVGLAAVPLVLPIGWMALNWVRAGHPLRFAQRTAEYFTAAYGKALFASVLDQVLYYPVSLLRADPLLVVFLGAAALWILPRRHEPRLLALLVALWFGLFYGSSVLSRTVGAFNERFMFSFALALVPMLGALPVELARARRGAAALVIGLGLLWSGSTAAAIMAPPVEWQHSPDLLAVTDYLGQLARKRSEPPRVVVGPGMDPEKTPLLVQNGRRVRLLDWRNMDPGALESGEGFDVWIERVPARITAVGPRPGAIIGRYHLYGSAVATPTGLPTLAGWKLVDESGAERSADADALLALEFTSDDPEGGASARLIRLIQQTGTLQRATLEVRAPYGHGFQLGRVTMRVTADSKLLFERDVAAPSGWHQIDFEVPAGTGHSRLEVSVNAQPGIERGWAWGRCSTVFVRDFKLN